MERMNSPARVPVPETSHLLQRLAPGRDFLHMNPEPPPMQATCQSNDNVFRLPLLEKKLKEEQNLQYRPSPPAATPVASIR